MSTPLRWCLDWDRLSFRDRFFAGSPLFSTETRAYTDIVKQLAVRTEDDLKAWDTISTEVSSLARDISVALVQEGVWPLDAFLPNDPADIPLGDRISFTYRFDAFPAAMARVEWDLGIRMEETFWEGLHMMSYAEAVSEIAANRRSKGQQARDRAL